VEDIGVVLGIPKLGKEWKLFLGRKVWSY